MYFNSHSQSAYSSQTWLQDNTGKLIMSNSYTDVDGSPYLPIHWIEGSVQLKTGKIIQYNALRLNLINGHLEFQLNDKSYDVVNAIDEFNLGAMKFRNGFEGIDRQNKDTFYQVLYDGKQKILCYRIGVIYLDAPYNSATKTKKIDLTEKYYLQKTDGKLYPFKKNLKELLSLVGDKSSQVNDFCKKENLKLRNWDEAVKVLEYVDTLGEN
jgi:hypothetical protein